jgi:hypothetical protein
MHAGRTPATAEEIPATDEALRNKTFRFGRLFGAALFHLNATSFAPIVTA